MQTFNTIHVCGTLVQLPARVPLRDGREVVRFTLSTIRIQEKRGQLTRQNTHHLVVIPANELKPQFQNWQYGQLVWVTGSVEWIGLRLRPQDTFTFHLAVEAASYRLVTEPHQIEDKYERI